MLMTGIAYRDSIRDGREIWIDGERVDDVTVHPAFKPAIDIRARVYDMAHEVRLKNIMSFHDDDGEPCAIAWRPPRTKDDWQVKRQWVDAVLDDIGGIATRLGDETIGALWSLLDARDVLDDVDPRFTVNIEHHVARVVKHDLFHVSANTDPKGDRSKRPQDQDPDMLLHVVRETSAGIIVRGAKYETAAAYAHQAFVKPTIANWGDATMSDYALGFICAMNAPGLIHICRSGFAGRAQIADYPLANRFDEIDTLLIFNDVLIPWENVLFYRHTKAAGFIRSMLHRYSGFPFVQRILAYADLMIGTALFNVQQTGLDKQQPVREKLAELVCYRESINAHLTAAIELGERTAGGLIMPHQSTLYAGRYLACSGLPQMMHIARELCGGQICLTPDESSFAASAIRPWLEKYYSVNETWGADDRRKLLAFARDLLNSDYAGHRLTFQLFAQSPPFAHLNAIYQTFDFSPPLEMVFKAAGLSERVRGGATSFRVADQRSI